VFVDVFQICVAGYTPSLVRTLKLLVDAPHITLTGIQPSKVLALRLNGAFDCVGVFGEEPGSHFAFARRGCWG
jgi:hypothetical protein